MKKLLAGKTLRRWAPFVGLILLGVVVFLVLKGTRAQPKKRPPTELGKAVRVLAIADVAVVPRAIGYGIVNAKQQWEMVAQVGGRVIEMSELLAVGKIIPKGTLLLRIDPEDYQLAASQQAATVAGIKAQIAQLTAQEKSAKASLAIEEKSLDLAKRDLDRKRKLFQSGSVSQTEVDGAERSLLTQQKAVQQLRNGLRELPAQRRVLGAQIKERQAGVKGAQLGIQRTEIVAPFDVRIRQLNVEASEVVSPNQVLAVGDGIDVAEVPAQLTLSALRPIFRFRALATGKAPLTAMSTSKVLEQAEVTALVRLTSGEVRGHWEARLDRFGNVDSTTRTISVVVSIDEPFRNAMPGKRPPLLSGMYVEVELRGPSRKGCKAVPRSALHDDQIYLVNTESRLERRPVKVAFRQATFVCLESGVEPGEQVVLTDLVPVVEGMLLDARPDEAAATRLTAAVKGEGDAK